MSDLTAMYARLRGTITEQAAIQKAIHKASRKDQSPCRHPRRQQRIERTEEFRVMGSARYSHYRVTVTTEIHCDACGQIIGSETHQERRR